VAGLPSTITRMFYAGQNTLSAFYLFLIVSLATLVAVVLFTDAHRSIPVTYANQGAGRGVRGNIPIRLNQAGMIPIIFAISLITFPSVLAQFLQTAPRFAGVVNYINTHLNSNTPSITYMVIYFALVMAFTYFYVSVTFKPDEVAESIQKRGGFIPGVRPGRETALMLQKTSSRLNLWGGIFAGPHPLRFRSHHHRGCGLGAYPSGKRAAACSRLRETRIARKEVRHLPVFLLFIHFTE
jgi:preprotein translocase subunit SecY